jgi:uncharacterized protein YkwD
MADSSRRIERSGRQISKLIPAALLIGVAAMAGCGGGGGRGTTPTAQVSRPPRSVVPAGATIGLVGPVTRATDRSQQFDDQTARISPRAEGKTGAEKHGVIAPGQCPGGDLMPDDGNLAQLNDATLCLVNGERADNGLPPLSRSTQLDQSSQGMCQRMVTERFFAHETPDGKNLLDRVRPTGYVPQSGNWVLGENLAWGDGPLSTPQSIVNGWMNSPGHRANILAPDYKEIGLAACMGAPLTTRTGGTVYVNNFGARSGADLNLRLPVHQSAVSRARTAAKRLRARRRAACLRRAKRVRSATRRRAAVSRCRRL